LDNTLETAMHFTIGKVKKSKSLPTERKEEEEEA
jgi:hypothetical protein